MSRLGRTVVTMTGAGAATPAKELVSLADTTISTGLIERSAAAFASGMQEGAGDDGFFGPASVTWRMSADLASPVAGLRSLLMQALHPLAAAGAGQHGGWRRDPVGRLAAATAYLTAVTFGDRAAARHAAARVRRIHGQVRGAGAVTGRPYAGGDPAVLLWVHGALVDSVLAAGNLVGTALEHELACRFDLRLDDSQPGGPPCLKVASSLVIDSQWVTRQRIPALGRRIVMTCSVSLEPDT
jgi:hypothetical protein